MKATIRGVKALLALTALAALGLGLRWATAGSVEAASTEDLTSMAVLTVGAIAWVAYTWLLLAVLATALENAPGAIGQAASALATRITSQTSRALLRSALGVAAVTPLTLGVAHATPSRPPASLHLIDSPAAARKPHATSPADWRAIEKPSSVRLTGTPADNPDQRRLAPTPPSPPNHRPTPPTPPQTSWRANERASTVRLTEASKELDQRTAVPTHHPTQPKPERVEVPTRPKPERVEVPTRPKPGQVGVPDRPTVGAPTRYTDVRSGKPLRIPTRVVQYGDTLWGLAAAELGPTASNSAIDARWHDWYAANRALIGPDPDRLYPGQVLRIPAPATDHPVPPTHQEK